MSEAKTRSEKIRETKAANEAQKAAINKEQRIQDELINLRNKSYTNPTRTFSVGQAVTSLNSKWKNIQIKDVQDNGLFYRITFEMADKKGTVYIENYVPWTDLISQDHKFSSQILNKKEETQDFEVASYSVDIDTLLSIYYNGIEMNPDYQRGFVWTQENKTALIEAVFEGSDIGKFALIKNDFDENNQNKARKEILDGKQRLMTLVEFYEDRFKYKGLKFSELNPKDQYYFQHYPVTYTQTWKELNAQQKYKYFIRLNSFGVKQDEKHLQAVKKLIK